jgi:hypothetical protein
VTASTLVEEIAEIEAQLERSKSYVLTSRAENSAITHLARAFSERSSLGGNLAQNRVAADAAQRQKTTLSGITKWQPATLNGSVLSFQYVGPVAKACVYVSFQVTGSGTLYCKAQVQSDLFLKGKGRTTKQFNSVSSFLEQQTAAVCAMACKESIDSPIQVGPVLRRLEWMLGRLEHTSSELAMLQRRYDAVLSPGQSSFQLEVEFSSQTGKAKLLATFELSDAYPFSPLNVCLDTFEEELDVEGIRKLLIKNAKPGFGYLSRTCDVIAAYLR